MRGIVSLKCAAIVGSREEPVVLAFALIEKLNDHLLLGRDFIHETRLDISAMIRASGEEVSDAGRTKESDESLTAAVTCLLTGAKAATNRRISARMAASREGCSTKLDNSVVGTVVAATQPVCAVIRDNRPGCPSASASSPACTKGEDSSGERATVATRGPESSCLKEGWKEQSEQLTEPEAHL